MIEQASNVMEIGLLGGRLDFHFNSPPVHDFTFTPSMSLLVEFGNADALKAAFEALSKDGKVAMPLDDYGLSPLFGWCQDRFVVSWQLSLSAPE